MSDADRVVLVLHQHPARLRARALAVAEAVSVLGDANAAVETGGPLAEQSGVAWISVDAHRLPDVEDRIGYLGYVEAVDIVEPTSANDRQAVGWRKRPWHLRRIHAADHDQLRRQSPDQRTFVLGSAEKTRVVRGYRGSSAPLERRGLPVIDARLLANLAARGRPGSRLLDPFAGAGGIVVAGEHAGYATYGADVDSEVAVGLRVLTQGRHVVADACRLPFDDAHFDGIATELPFDPSADEVVGCMRVELARVLRPGGTLAVMCVERQARQLRDGLPSLRSHLDHEVDRKGLAVRVLVWERS
jgi:SAM-dependent methyltransferase